MYRIQGLDPRDFAHFAALGDADLAARGAVRLTADGPGFPCRVTLEDAAAGEELILLHHVSHDVATPYRAAYAIYVRAAATVAATYVDSIPPALKSRPLALRAFGVDGMLRTARLVKAGKADDAIRDLFADDAIDYIDAHNAAHGCFAARVTRNSGN